MNPSRGRNPVRLAATALLALAIGLGRMPAIAAEPAGASPFGSDVDGWGADATLYFYSRAACPGWEGRDACYVVAFSCVRDGSAVLTLRAPEAEVAGVLASGATAVVEFDSAPPVVLAALSAGLESVGFWQFRFFAEGRRGDRAWLAGLADAAALDIRRSDGAVLHVPLDAENRRDATQFAKGCLRQ